MLFEQFHLKQMEAASLKYFIAVSTVLLYGFLERPAV